MFNFVDVGKYKNSFKSLTDVILDMPVEDDKIVEMVDFILKFKKEAINKGLADVNGIAS